MEFQIVNGKNICLVGLSDIGSYFRFNTPTTVVWADCKGSIGKYFCVLPYNEEYRKTVSESILNNLNEDFSNRAEELHEILSPLFPILENGKYHLSYFSQKENEFFQYKSSNDGYEKTHFHALEVIFAIRATEKSNTEELKENYKAYLKSNKNESEYGISDIMEYTTESLYPGSQSLFATQPYSEIDEDRVKYFEEQIKSGVYPFAILMNAYSATIDEYSAYFILDGHHKLLAYANLGIYPPIALITRQYTKDQQPEFDVEKLNEYLFPWQTEHLLENWEGKDKYIERVLQNPNSNLHGIVKNGEIKEYHDNGKLKHQAFYINGKIEGKAKYYYKNGRLQREENYENGLRKGIWKNYFQSGKIEFIQPFNEFGQYHGKLTSYYENGQIRLMQEIHNGINKDGNTYKSWFENGDLEAELVFKNGQIISRKNWNSYGEFVSHEEFKEQTGRLEKVEIPSDQLYDKKSTNYKNRQREIRKIYKGNQTFFDIIKDIFRF